MTTLRCMLLIGALVLGARLAHADDVDTAALSRDAERALADGDWSAAADAFAALAAADPDEAAFPFNEAIARYRVGELAAAAGLFDEAARRAASDDLRSRAAYNAGTARHAEALTSLEDPTAAAEGMTHAQEQLEAALGNYKEALAANPANGEARANAEMAQRLLRELQQMQPPQQGDPQPQEGDDQEEGDDQQSSEGQDQQQQDQQPSDQGEQSQDEPQQGEGEESQPQDGDTGEDENQASAGGEGDEDEAAPSEGELPETEDEPSDAESGEGSGSTGDEMTREEAERLLQRVRDNDRRRREARAAEERARHRPATRDW